MALLLHSGASSTDLGVSGTKRDDISDYLAACLVLANTTAGAIRVGPEFADSIAQWDEDRLNNDFITDLTSGGQSTSSTSMTVSTADAAILDLGYVMADTSAAAGGIANGEFVQVTAISGTTVTFTRAFGGSTATSHAQNAIWSIIARPTLENSDLGRDMSRARIRKYNYLHRHELNVNLSSEVIMRSRKGYTPGIQDELEYQFFQRTQEVLRIWDKSVLYSKPSPGTTGSAGFSGGDYSTMAGIRAWLDTTMNATSAIYDYQTSGLTAGQLDRAINAVNISLFQNGVVNDWAIGGANAAQDIGRLYSDRIRLQQDDSTRGFSAMYFRTTLANELRMMLDGFVESVQNIGDLFILDSGRARLRPLAEQFFFVITAPTLRDGDQIRAISKLTLEMRNTGSDVGQAHEVIRNIIFTS